MVHVKLDCGFEMDVNTEALKKWEFFSLIRKAEDDPLLACDIVEIVFGDKLNDLLFALDDSGNPDFEAVKDALSETLNKSGAKDSDVKN